jgi:hypothetical protein
MASAERPITRINRLVATVPDGCDHATTIAQTRSQKGMTVLRVMRMAMRGLCSSFWSGVTLSIRWQYVTPGAGIPVCTRAQAPVIALKCVDR